MPHTDPQSVPSLEEEAHIKLEGSELDKGTVASSSAWLLSDDFERMAMVADKDADTLRSQVQLAANEYKALDQRYDRLNHRHEELHKLCSAYVDVICGSSSPEKQSVSIEQLRAEAGREGMRAKALQADVLKPIIREAGGLHALVSQTESVRPLINKVGGVHELEDLVSEMHLVRIALNEVGGLQGLYNLIAEEKRLKEEQLNTRDRIEGPNGLAEKAAKYDRLVQAFSEIQAQREYAASTRHVAPAGAATMNPARASLIAFVPLEHDPYRDLYEPPPAAEPRNKTGSNNVPLGHPRACERPSRWDSKNPLVKQEPMDDIDMEQTPNKRPRKKLEHSPVPMQISGTPSLEEEPSQESFHHLPEYQTGHKRRMRY